MFHAFFAFSRIMGPLLSQKWYYYYTYLGQIRILYVLLLIVVMVTRKLLWSITRFIIFYSAWNQSFLQLAEFLSFCAIGRTGWPARYPMFNATENPWKIHSVLLFSIFKLYHWVISLNFPFLNHRTHTGGGLCNLSYRDAGI